MAPIVYIDRLSGQRKQERVYGESLLKLLYGNSLASSLFGKPLGYLFSRVPLCSAFVGYLQNRPASVKKIRPFIEKHAIDPNEFQLALNQFSSFNDFFIRKLKPDVRPIATGSSTAAIPADGRYLFYQNISKADGFVVKGQKFCLASLLKDQALANQYETGAMMIARLCPSDYHRYHFPCNCIPSESTLINGWLYSVNPIAIKKNLSIFTENKRTLCLLQTDNFGQVLFLEIGATCVGAIHQTYTPNKKYAKGDEKGYFSFGASSLIVIFPPNTIQFDQDLLNASRQHIEIRCLMGQSMGTIQTTNVPSI